MKNYLLLAFTLILGSITAQEQAIDSPSTSKTVIQQDSLSVMSSSQSTQSKDIVLDANTLETRIVNDTTTYIAKDHAKIAALDSLWKQELFSTTVFDTMYKSINELTYEPVIYEELPTDTLKARLKALNARTPFNVEYNPGLESVIKRYLKTRQKSLQKLVTLSQFYFPMFEQELDNQNIPLEMKYLAIVESALKPRAKSRVGATGLWQFMYGTGKMFGLEVSSYVDERMDPIMATKAACKYLGSLYRVFGDWDLALAAYNSGPGNVNKAIRRSGGRTNYWNIRHNLPRETAGYVPAFLATMYIFEYAEEHGFNTKHKPQFAYYETDTVSVKQMISLDQVSDYMNIPIEELQFLNPSYKLDVIPNVKDEDYVLRLPLDQVGKFVANETQVYTLAQTEFNKREKPLPRIVEANNRIRYRVRSGDFLGKIARRYGVRVSQIKRWNGLRSNNLRIGQRLTIHPRKPVSSAKKQTKISKSVSNKKQTVRGNNPMYTVRSGDTLWSISKKFSGITIENLKKWNDISGSGIKPGMKLKISKS